jgi:hypothetical protein
MRYGLMGLCIFAAACSSQSVLPTSPASVAGVSGAQTQAKGARNVEVSFTKWVAGFPALAGVTGGDAAGTFAGTVISRDPFDNGTIVQLEAQYGITADDPAHSFVADIKGTQNNQTQQAVLNGTVVSGWLAGAQVHVTYDIIAPAPGISCVPKAPMNTRCFQGTIRIMPGSAN